jgi:hypothetical protein
VCVCVCVFICSSCLGTGEVDLLRGEAIVERDPLGQLIADRHHLSSIRML